MANYSNLKAAIAAAIKQNGNQEITGQVLQDVLTSIVSVIGANYTFAGVATPATNPGTPDQNVVYIASQAGKYTNFGGIELPIGISLLIWNEAWTAQTLPTEERRIIATTNEYNVSYPCFLTAGKYVLGLTNHHPTQPTGVFFFNSNNEQINQVTPLSVSPNCYASCIYELPEDCSSVKIAGVGTELLIAMHDGLEQEIDEIKGYERCKIIGNNNNYVPYYCSLPAGKYTLELTNHHPTQPTGVFFFNSNNEQINQVTPLISYPDNTVLVNYDLPESCDTVRIAGVGTEFKISEYGLKGVEQDVEDLKNPPITDTVITVDANGTIGTDCDFTDIKSALDSISDNTQYNRYVVLIKNGTYDITGINYLGLKNYVIVKGENRDGVIVRNSAPSLNQNVSCFDPAYYGNNIIEYASIEDITMKINNGKCCVHIDGHSIIDGGRILIKHCRLINEVENVNGGINCGLNGGQTVEVDDCFGTCLAYAHTRVNPSTSANPNNFIIKNSCLDSIGFYDISDKVSDYKRNKLIVENCKCDYIGIGVAESASNKAKCSIDYIIDKNTIFNWVYILGQNFITGYNNWFTKYPICSSIHSFVSNNSGNTITKGTFVSISIQGGVPALNNTIPQYGYNIVPYNGEHLYGIALEDIADGDAGIVQVGGKIFIPNNNYTVGQYIALNEQGQPIVGTKENAIGVIINPDQPFIGQTLMLLTNTERAY